MNRDPVERGSQASLEAWASPSLQRGRFHCAIMKRAGTYTVHQPIARMQLNAMLNENDGNKQTIGNTMNEYQIVRLSLRVIRCCQVLRLTDVSSQHTN